ASKEPVAQAGVLTAYERGELEAKIEELEQTTGHLANLLCTRGTVIVVVDRRLRVRWFSPAARSAIDLYPEIIGRPITDVALALDDPALVADATRVLRTRASAEREVIDQEGKWLARRVLPYRRKDGSVDGLVITVDDVTERKHAEARVRHQGLHDALTGLP